MLIRQGVPLPAKLFDNKMATDLGTIYRRPKGLLIYYSNITNWKILMKSSA